MSRKRVSSIKYQVSRQIHHLRAVVLRLTTYDLRLFFRARNQESRAKIEITSHPEPVCYRKGFGQPGRRSRRIDPLKPEPLQPKSLQPKSLSAFIQLAVVLLFTVLTLPLRAQLLTPLSHEMNRRVEYEMMKSNTLFFTVLKPYVDTQLRGNARQDSLNIIESSIKYQDPRQIQSKNGKPYDQEPGHSSGVILSGVEGRNTWFNRKLFHESFIRVDSGDFYLFADPEFEFGLGKEIGGRNTYTNTRGFRAGGRLGNHFAFGVDFYENQDKFYSIISNKIDKNRIAPGEGWARKIDTMSFDFAHSSGYINLAIKNFNFRFAQGRQFIGEGYRSLLLSDASYVYPYLNISWANKRFLYVWSNMLFQDMDIAYTKKVPPFRRKSATMHLIGLAFRKIQFSLIKQDLYKNPDTFDNYKWDFNQLNPLFLPLKRSDKGTILGSNIRFNPINQITIYNQIVLINPYNKSKKVCYQFGGKLLVEFGENKLHFQSEYNEIPTLAYISGDRLFNWEHFREPLAHPYGNNFKELIFSSVWDYRRLQLFCQLINATQLGINFDQSMAKNAIFPYFSGGRKLKYIKAEISYFINTKTLMNFKLGITIRQESLSSGETELKYIYFSFGTSLFNKYYDF